MVTEISPIFGLTLVGMVEWAAIGAVTGSALIAYVIHKRNKELLEQQKKASSERLEQQKKVDSARLIRELFMPWKKNAAFKKFLGELNDPKVTKYDDDMLEEVLNQFEIIATHCDDELLLESHVRSFLSANLRSIRTDEYIQGHIRRLVKINPRTYLYLKDLLEKSKKWDT